MTLTIRRFLPAYSLVWKARAQKRKLKFDVIVALELDNLEKFFY
jgi:hypothetical protein